MLHDKLYTVLGSLLMYYIWNHQAVDVQLPAYAPESGASVLYPVLTLLPTIYPYCKGHDNVSLPENNLYNQLTDVQYIFHFLHCCSFYCFHSKRMIPNFFNRKVYRMPNIILILRQVSIHQSKILFF